MNITVIHRADGSGTTFIWTNFLSKSNADFARKNIRQLIDKGNVAMDNLLHVAKESEDRSYGLLLLQSRSTFLL